jgi:hypothetical protein
MVLPNKFAATLKVNMQKMTTALGGRDVEPGPWADNLPCANAGNDSGSGGSLMRYRTGVDVDLAGGWGVRRRPHMRRMEASALEVKRWKPVAATCDEGGRGRARGGVVEASGSHLRGRGRDRGWILLRG